MIIKYSLIVFIIFILTGCGGGSSSNGFVKVENKQLQYFGFALVDCQYDDPNDNNLKTNYIDEVSGFTNIGQMSVSAPNEIIAERLSIFKQSGIAAVLHIESILFAHSYNPTTGSGTKVTLRVDAKMRWANFVTLNKAVLTTQHIAAIYVVDEPSWNGLSFTEFTEALQIVKTILPNIPTMIIEAYPMVGQIMVTDNLDWLGFDRYDSVDPEHDAKWLADLDTVAAARTRIDQKIVIVASTQWLPHYLEANIQPEDMEQVAISYFNVAKSYPGVIALIGYVWPGGLDHPKQLGARNLPINVQESLKKIGNEILSQ